MTAMFPDFVNKSLWSIYIDRVCPGLICTKKKDNSKPYQIIGKFNSKRPCDKPLEIDNIKITL